jgi:hypothetical protein
MDAIKQGALEQDEMNWVRRYGQLVKLKKSLGFIK